MPVLHKYKDRPDYYILTRIKDNIITFQLTDDGQRRLQGKGIRTGDKFPRALLLDLYRSGQAFTQGTGPGEKETLTYIVGMDQGKIGPLWSFRRGQWIGPTK